jgi:hypothetical protein
VVISGEVYSAEIMLQLNDLDEIREERSEVRIVLVSFVRWSHI